MFHQPSLPTARKPNRKKIHQHHESKKWARLPANEKCLECYPVRKLFLETAFGKLPPEIRADLFKMVLTVGSLSPLKYGISVPMAKPQRVPHPQLTRCPARPASCLALLQTCRQIHRESSLLFYAINTLYLSNPQDMLSFLRHLGPTRIGEIRSLHLEDVFVQMPMWRQGQLDTLRSQGLVSEDILASFASERGDMMNPDAENAIKQLNKCGKLRKMYLDMRPSQTLAYVGIWPLGR